MEESAEERCSVVYYCANTDGEVRELHHRSAPEPTVSADQKDGYLDSVYENVRTLLDEDQGGFHEGARKASASVALRVYHTDCA